LPATDVPGDNAKSEAYVAEQDIAIASAEQLALGLRSARRLIGHHLIDLTDEAGYLQGDLQSVAEQLGAPLELVEETLAVMQGFEPCGVFARDLRECLALQLKEQDRYDPAMASFIDKSASAVHVSPR
jgi:RNA polymerase sigma-54 factor